MEGEMERETERGREVREGGERKGGKSGLPLSIIPAQYRIFDRQASSVAPRTPPSPSMCNCT